MNKNESKPFALDASHTDQYRRFSGLDRLYGVGSYQKIHLAHVVVVGVGGVGSWAVEALARSGVGRLTLLDADHVAASNVNRQIQALTSTLGMAKVEALKCRINEINPFCDVRAIDAFVDDENILLLPQEATLVLDCADQMSAKWLMLSTCVGRNQKILVCGAAGGKTDGTRVQIADLAHSVQDPILAKLRHRYRKARNIKNDAKRPKQMPKLGVPVLFSDEAIRYPVPASASAPESQKTRAQTEASLNCAGFGSSVMVTASFGLAAAQWAISEILNQGD